MIAKVAKRGHSFAGIVSYLLGAGRGEEHTGQRVIVASGDLDVPVGRQLNSEERTTLADQLGVYSGLFPQACPPGGPVFHLVFSLPEGEVLSDGQWSQLARDSARLLDLERDGGAVASWAAFRHGLSKDGHDHIHFVASLVRSDGSEVDTYMRNGYAALHAVARRAEQRFGLQPLLAEGSVPVAQRGEQEAAVRRERLEPERATLARVVRAAAVASSGEVEFLDGLADAKVIWRPRYGTGGTTTVVGYSVALRPADGGQPVWFGGGKLGRDLTLPALRARWAEPSTADRDSLAGLWQGRRVAPGVTVADALKQAARQPSRAVWERAADRLAAVGEGIEGDGELPKHEWQTVSGEAAGVAAGLAGRLETGGPGGLSTAADMLARCAQRPVGSPPPSLPSGRGLRGVAAVCAAQRMGGSPEGWLRVVRELARLAETLARSAENRASGAYHAQMAARAAADLHAAYDTLTAVSPKRVSRSHSDDAGYGPARDDTPPGGTGKANAGPVATPGLESAPDVSYQPPDPGLEL